MGLIDDKVGFKICVDKWHSLTREEKEEWKKKAEGKNISSMNHFLTECQKGKT